MLKIGGTGRQGLQTFEVADGRSLFTVKC